MRRALLAWSVAASLVASVLASGTAVAAPGDEAYRLTEVLAVSGPVTLTQPPGDERRFVATLGGRVLLLRPDGSSETFLDLSDRVSVGGERGLLGLAFSPDHRRDGRLWVNYTDTAGDTVVARYEVSANDPDRVDPGSHTVVLRVEQPFSNHNGGMLAFADDGMLLVGLGDGGSSGDPLEAAEDPASLLGSILRLDVVDRAGTGYRVPPDNPWVGSTSGADEVWISGVRNPWRFSVDRLTGDVWIGDVGQGDTEEVDRVPYRPSTAVDLGWDRWEGSRCFEGPCTRAGLTFPVTEYRHAEAGGCSITGGHVSRAASTPTLYGTYLYGDFCGGWVEAFDPGAGTTTRILEGLGGIIGFGEDAAGELYVLTLDGVLALRGEGSGTTFSDVPAGGTFATDVAALVEAGVTSGCEPRVPHRYCPSAVVTRGQMAVFVARAAGLPDAAEDFTDVDDDGGFAGAIGAVAAAGITVGCDAGGTRFCPERPITRQELAAFLARALDLAEAPTDFVDVDGPLAGSVGAVAEAGITGGCDADGRRFCPTEPVLRAPMARFLVNAFGL